jgi:hypothetical protein
MWILSWIPDWIFYIIFAIGIVGFTASLIMRFIPVVYMYKPFIQIFSITLIAIGTYMSGAISNEEEWKNKVKILEIKIAESEAKSQQINAQIIEKVITKTQIVREKGKDIVQYIDREVVKQDTQCKISKETVSALNQAAEGIEK